jgi:hypothetical protein
VSGQLGIDGEVQPERVCACGCPRSMEGKRPNALYASDGCRTKAYKARHNITGYRAVKPSLNGKKRGRRQLYLRPSEAEALYLAVDALRLTEDEAAADEDLGRALEKLYKLDWPTSEQRERQAA